MIDPVTLFNGAMALIALMLVIWAGASIITGILAEPGHAITDDWEDRLFGRRSG